MGDGSQPGIDEARLSEKSDLLRCIQAAAYHNALLQLDLRVKARVRGLGNEAARLTAMDHDDEKGDSGMSLTSPGIGLRAGDDGTGKHAAKRIKLEATECDVGGSTGGSQPVVSRTGRQSKRENDGCTTLNVEAGPSVQALDGAEACGQSDAIQMSTRAATSTAFVRDNIAADGDKSQNVVDGSHLMAKSSLEQLTNALSQFWDGIAREDTQELVRTQCGLSFVRLLKIAKQGQHDLNIHPEVPVLFSRIVHIFLMEISVRAWFESQSQVHSKISLVDVRNAILRCDEFDFLVEALGDTNQR